LAGGSVDRSVLMKRALPLWILFGGLATVAALASFVGVQQVLRRAADHPQIEIARAAADKLSAGASPQSVVTGTPINIASSSDTYLIVVDSTGALLATSAQLDGSSVMPPAGVFTYVRDHGEDVISWQPAAGVRSAIVIDSFRGGYVVAGRSLTWTEQAESALGFWAVIAWAAAVMLAGGLSLLVEWLRHRGSDA
jgi:hypothetical protein